MHTTDDHTGGSSAGDSRDTDAAAARIKEVVFEYVGESDTIPAMIAAGDFDGVTRDIISSCGERARRAGSDGGVSDEKTLCVLATAILHHGLTRALVKSQRKITYRGEHIDVVIPDAGTLDSDPRRALVICVMDTSDEDAICERAEAAARVQHIRENIWMVVPDCAGDMGRGASGPSGVKAAPGIPKRFAISYEGGIFTRIFSEIGRFQGAGRTGGLRILGIG